MKGPGRYDDLATRARKDASASAVILVILGGSKGSGFSVQSRTDIAPRAVAMILRDMADRIENDAVTS